MTYFILLPFITEGMARTALENMGWAGVVVSSDVAPDLEATYREVSTWEAEQAEEGS